ncbi:MAG: PHP domain-containing protein [Acidobacteria bacterium]|nr:PHP domain-containing protein [Acidobacteriota bacterium]
MRADLHVHSHYSDTGRYARAGLRDCYARPGEIYDRARGAGMNLVTLTDLNTIEGCLRLIDERGAPPDFVIGEEIEARFPDSGARVHLCAWGLTEERHREVCRLRENAEDLVAYLCAERVACALSHFVSKLPVGFPEASVYRRALELFDAVEVRNGAQGRHYNALVAALAMGRDGPRGAVGFVGGSDAHTLRRVGTTWTEAEARTPADFLEEIRSGRTSAGGRVRGAADIFLDLASLASSHYASLPSRLAGPGREGILRLAADLPRQIVGVPLVGTILYFVGVRRQVRAMQREIAIVDLREFRSRMRSYPRPAPGPAGSRESSRP